MKTPYQGMLVLLRELVGSPNLEALWATAVGGFVDLLPYAQAGSVLVREGGVFRFAAFKNYALSGGLPGVRYTLEEELQWYGGTLEEALAGIAKINQIHPEMEALLTDHKHESEQIQWIMTLPIPFEGQVEAWIHLDRFEADPFPKEALKTGQELAQSLEVALRALREREYTRGRLEREELMAQILSDLPGYTSTAQLWEALPGLASRLTKTRRLAALQRQGDELVFVSALGWRQPMGLRIPRGQGVAWKAAEAKAVQMVHLDDPSIFFISGYEKDPEDYGAFVPLYDSSNEVLGVLNVYSTLPISLDDRSLLEVFGRAVGQALSRLQAQEQELQRLETISRIGQRLNLAKTTDELLHYCVQEALEQTKASCCLLSLYHDKHLEIVVAQGRNTEHLRGVRIAPGQGLSWKVFESGQSLYMADASKNPDAMFAGPRIKAAYLGVPLCDPEGRVLGVLSVDTAGNGGEIQPQDRYSLEALAKMTGVSLSRLQAIEHAYHQTDNYRALVQMSTELELTSDPLEIARKSLQALMDLVGLDAGALYRIDTSESGDWLEVMEYMPAIPEMKPELLARVPVGEPEGVLARLLQGRKVSVVEDYARWEGAYPNVVPTGLGTVMACPLWLNNRLYGLLALGSFHRTIEIGDESRALLEAVARRLERALERIQHLEEVFHSREDALRTLGLGLELRDLETRGHTDRVVELAVALGQKLGFSDLEGLRIGAYLHDLGKLAIHDEVLLKPQRLSRSEWEIMKRHCDIGSQMIEDLEFLPQTARNVVRFHHERLDGSGYPMGLTCDSIPLEARIFAVVDVYDALMHSRPYKRAWTLEETHLELRRQAGSTLDSKVVETMITLTQNQEEALTGYIKSV